MPTVFDSAAAVTTRTCRLCGFTGPLNRTNFYQRSVAHPFETRCQTCRRARNAEVRAARRNGTSVRSGRKFGVEIEYIGTRDALAAEMTARGLRVRNESYTHRVMAEWKIVTDGSLMRGYELVSPPLRGADGLRQLKLACEALAAAGCTVDSSCGLHVHHDVSDLTAAHLGRLFRAWSNNQPSTDMLVARSRRGSRWAQPLRETEVQTVERLPSMERGIATNHFRYTDRYRALNVACFPRYGTVEVRQHQGTLNYSKIAAWIAFGQAFVALAKSDAPTDATGDVFVLVDLLSGHGLPADQATYLRGRAAHFSGRRQPVAA